MVMMSFRWLLNELVLGRTASCRLLIGRDYWDVFRRCRFIFGAGSGGLRSDRFGFGFELVGAELADVQVLVTYVEALIA